MEDDVAPLCEAAELRKAEQLRDSLKVLMGIRKGEVALIVYDDYAAPVSAVTRRALELEGVAVRLYHLAEKGRPCLAIPSDLGDLIESLRPDLFFNQLKGYAAETPFRIALHCEESKHGARVGHSPDIDPGMIAHAMTADFKAMRQTAARLKKRFRAVRTVRLAAPGGTDVAFSVSGRAFVDDLSIRPGHMGNLPAGEIWCAPVERSMSGTIVCDGSVGDLGLVREPLFLSVEAGRVVRVRSNDDAMVREVETLLAEDADASLAGEFGIGLNPKARVTGLMIEDEKACGTAHIAFGQNTDMPGGCNNSVTHRDFLIRRPSIVDQDTGEYVMRDGKFV
ncbi:MAG: Thermophilic metalloprotease (M29) [Methanocella sp. PtaU1.Bin125]|nr:MAG: Thermophilic metalloprotease (M29) [Methanocella sp. PtaU1.Bin125]